MVNFTLIIASLFDYNNDFYFIMENLVNTPSYTITENNINIEAELDFICTLETNLYYDFVVFDDYTLTSDVFNVDCELQQALTADEIHHIEIEYIFDESNLLLTSDTFQFSYSVDIVCSIFGWRGELITYGERSYSDTLFDEIPFSDDATINFNSTNYSQELFNLQSEQEAYNAGFAAGKNEGYTEAMAIGDSIGAMLGGVFEGINAFLNIQLVPGITFGLIVLIPIVFGVVQFIMNFWR